MTDRTIRGAPPLVAEVLGPAGAGKTTLSRALRARRDDVAPDIDPRLSKLDKLPYVASDVCRLLPTYLRRYRHSRWFDRRETRSMAYLQAGLRLLEHNGAPDARVTLLDHGPLYRLAFLREFGPEITTSRTYRRWWADLLERWAATLDLVILLDAPSTILLDRVRSRDAWHVVKATSDREALEILHRYRAAFERTLSEAMAAHRMTVLRYDTSRQSTEATADRIAEALGGGDPRIRDASTSGAATAEAAPRGARVDEGRGGPADRP